MVIIHILFIPFVNNGFMKSKFTFLLLLLAFTTLSACSTFKPEALTYQGFETGYKNKTMKYGVYTPPNWTPEENLPLVLFLHGGGDNHTSFEKFKAHQVFDEKINTGEMPRVILVTPDGGFSLWENWADGKRNYRDWVMRGVLPDVQQQYNTLSCPEHCHLLGISMGGFGAMRFAYFEKNAFSSVSVLSASILSDEQKREAKSSLFIRLLFPIKKIFGPNAKERNEKENVFRTWPTEPHLRNTRLQLIWGDKDIPRIRRANESFSQKLTNENIDHESHVYQGNHKWVSWKPQLSRAINFLVSKPNEESLKQEKKVCYRCADLNTIKVF